MEILFYNISNRPHRSNEENGDENNTIKNESGNEHFVMLSKEGMICWCPMEPRT